MPSSSKVEFSVIMSPNIITKKNLILSSSGTDPQEAFDPLAAIATQPVLYLDFAGLVDGATNDYGTVDASGNVSQWSDLSGNTWHFTQGTGMNQPLRTSEGLLFDGISQYLQSTAKSKALFLHDGTAFTLFFKWRTSDPDPENLQVLYDDCDYGGSATNIGHSTYYNDFSTSDDRAPSFIKSGVSGIAAGSFGSDGNYASPSTMKLTRVLHNELAVDDYTLSVDGTQIWAAATTKSFSSSPCTYNPTIGRRANTADSYLEGQLQKVLFYNVALSAGDIAILEANL